MNKIDIIAMFPKSLSPKSPLLKRFLSMKTETTEIVAETENLYQYLEEIKNYSIPRNEFHDIYEGLLKDRYIPLNKEFKNLVEISMQINQEQSSLLSILSNISSLFDHQKQITLQALDLKVYISQSFYSSSGLDCTYIHNGRQTNCIQYIISTDPSKESIVEFLRMIWKSKVKYVVTLTRLSREKFHGIHFWPALNNTIQFQFEKDSFSLFTKEEVQRKNLVKRIIKIVKNGEKHKVIKQFHVTTTVANNEPVYKSFKRLFIQLNEVKETDYPILFHTSNLNREQCSMLISIDKIIKNLENNEENINIYETVFQMNQYKNSMLVEERQYFDIYEYISCYLKKQSKYYDV